MNIQDAIVEIQQPRSRYQLIHFVLGQHDTPEMQFYQLMMELQDMGHKLRLAELGVRKAEIEIARLLETGDDLDAIEAEEKEVDLEHTRIVMQGAEREIAILTDLFDESQKFTRDEIEHAWRWVDTLIDGWESRAATPRRYPAGSWGPVSSIAMITRDGRSWYEEY